LLLLLGRDEEKTVILFTKFSLLCYTELMSIIIELICMIKHVRYEKGKTIRDTHNYTSNASSSSRIIWMHSNPVQSL
jgi:hypothetical protein